MSPLLVEHYIVDERDGILDTACGGTIPVYPLPPAGTPHCAVCEDLLTSGAVQ